MARIGAENRSLKAHKSHHRSERHGTGYHPFTTHPKDGDDRQNH